MKLAIIRQRYNPYGGAERFVDQALGSLSDHRIELRLYTRSWHRQADSPIAPVICDPPYWGSTARDRGFAAAVCRALAADPPDLVQSHERIACCDIFRAGDGVHRVWLAERARAQGFWSRMGVATSPYHRYTLHAEAKLFASPRLKAVICNSAMVRDELRSVYGLPEEKLHIIYNAVDSQRFSPRLQSHRRSVRESLGIADDAVVFLFVGSGFARKGLASAIEALAALPAKAHLVAVGHDKHVERYRRRIRAHGLSARAHLAGAQANPERYYGAADAFVLPTVYDPFPNAVLEAMACGLPVVTTSKCGAAELLLPASAGLVCTAGDIPALARHMHRLLDATTRKTMGAAAREAALPLAPAAMAKQLVALYAQLLDSMHASRETGHPSEARGCEQRPADGNRRATAI